jgi:arginine decarboxylase
MQAEMEGFDRLRQSLQIAQWIRHEFSSGPVRALIEEDLATKQLIKNNEVALDPLKITLYVQGIPGVRFREEELYRKLGIQINKYSHNTVLILVTIGTTWSMADHLVRSLKQWVPSPPTSHARALNIPTFSGFDARYAGPVEGTGKLATAYYAALQPGASQPVDLNDAIERTSAHFVTPYPPGYPLLVPGQKISKECVDYIRDLRAMGVQDIHGLGSDGKLFVLT